MEQSISKKQLLKKLFFSTLYLSTFTFGHRLIDENKICR